MRKIMGIFLAAAAGGAILLCLWKAPISFFDLLTQPVRTLWGSHQQLRYGVLKITENIEPLEAAAHELLKPFGAVQLIRHYPASAPPANEQNQEKQNTASSGADH